MDDTVLVVIKEPGVSGLRRTATLTKREAPVSC